MHDSRFEPFPHGSLYPTHSPQGRFHPTRFQQDTWTMMLRLARAEGIKPYVAIGDFPEEMVDDDLIVDYRPDDGEGPRVIVRSDLPLPLMRWALAVGLGHHFTGVTLDRRTTEAERRTAAVRWATQFLASLAAHGARPSIPRHVQGQPERTLLTPPARPNPPARPKRERGGIPCAAVTKSGKPCRARAKKGSPFCAKHQGERMLSVAEVMGGLSLEGGGRHGT